MMSPQQRNSAPVLRLVRSSPSLVDRKLALMADILQAHRELTRATDAWYTSEGDAQLAAEFLKCHKRYWALVAESEELNK